MPLEKQVCSLEYAKRLKELGEKQESLFYWGEFEGYHPLIVMKKVDGSIARYETEWDIGDERELADAPTYSAPTTAELGDRLPNWVRSYYTGEEWHCEGGDFHFHTKADTEANARVKMLIYLLENKLV